MSDWLIVCFIHDWTSKSLLVHNTSDASVEGFDLLNPKLLSPKINSMKVEAKCLTQRAVIKHLTRHLYLANFRDGSWEPMYSKSHNVLDSHPLLHVSCVCNVGLCNFCFIWSLTVHIWKHFICKKSAFIVENLRQQMTQTQQRETVGEVERYFRKTHQ